LTHHLENVIGWSADYSKYWFESLEWFSSCWVHKIYLFLYEQDGLRQRTIDQQRLGLDRYRYRVSADTRQYFSVSVLADTYLSIGTDTSSPVIRLPVSTVNTVAMHAYSFKPIPYLHAYTPHTYITCTHLYPTQNSTFSTKNLYSPVSVSVWLWPIVSGIGHLHGIGLTLPAIVSMTLIDLW